MKKTVSIIGGCGFLGSYVTKKFQTEGYAVKVSTRDISEVERFKHLQQIMTE